MPSVAFKNPVRTQRWDIEEGEAQEIAPRLKNSDAKALVFVSHSHEDDEQSRLAFETLKRASELIGKLLEEKKQRTWDALIAALTPDIPLTSNRVIEAKMLAQAMTAILESEDYVKASDLAELGNLSRSNPSSQPNRWKRRGEIFAVPYKGTDLFPVFGFELKEGVKPLPVMKELLEILREKSDWQKAFWFSSLNSYLKDRTPKDLLRSKPKAVLNAARIEARGVQHG